jgi:hypothetical protein
MLPLAFFRHTFAIILRLNLLPGFKEIRARHTLCNATAFRRHLLHRNDIWQLVGRYGASVYDSKLASSACFRYLT